MNVNQILHLHKKSKAPNSVSKCLGDGYLLSHNVIYKRIRSWAISQGLRFPKNQDEIGFAFPTLSLKSYKRSQAISVSDNISHLNALDSELKEKFGFRELQSAYALQNRLLHESVHCLADALGGPQSETESERVFDLLFEESLANGTELLAYSFVNDETHFYFMLLNTYLAMERSDVQALWEIRKRIGSKAFYRYVVLLSLKTQFLETNLPEKHLTKIRAAAGLRETGSLRDLQQLVEIVQMNDTFKIKTARIYFMAQGFEKHFFHYLDFDYLEKFQGSVRAKSLLKTFERKLISS